MDKEDDKGMVSCYIAVSPKDYENRAKILAETFKGTVEDKPMRFPKGLGAIHPFDFEDVDKILNNIGVANAMVDKIVDEIVGDFSVKIDDPESQTLLDDLILDSNLKSKLRPWIKEGVAKGNGFMELDLVDVKNIERMRVMKANHMFVRRNTKGRVLEYNQFKGKVKSFSDKSKVVSFRPNQIAHLQINKVPNDPYGMGLVWPNRITIENWASSELDLHKLQTRKAGAPMHVKMGQPGQKVKKADLDGAKADLQFLQNSTEWVTDANVEIKIVDFHGIVDNSIKTSEHDLELMSLGFKIPMSILGISNNPEGMAKTNDKGFLRFIQSVRGLVEEVLEEKVFRPFLREQSPKLDGRVEFSWELPGEAEKIERLKKITETLRVMDLSPELRAALEIEYAEIMELDVVDILPTPEEARKKADEQEAELKTQEDLARKEEEEQIKQPEVPGVKKTANQKAEVSLKEIIRKKGNEFCVFSKTGKNLGCFKTRAEAVKRLGQVERFKKETHKECNLTEAELNNMTIAKYVNLKEIAGFNYSDYLVKILLNLRTEKFEDLLALTEKDLLEGLLPKRDITKLKVILNDGFRKNKTIRQIENQINQSIDLKDRVKIQEDGTRKITLSASKRPISIARTETVRLANAGLKDMYLDNDIKSYRYLAALDDRTSDICNSLNGQVFLTKDGQAGVNMPPMHIMCRSSIVGLVD